ncbi:aldolase [Kocuria coralli]|uniref:Aldolase n=1 Tax=Kocuria coralli TaxID=1461025 RepID=A0A5J5KU51_9MICC|nr:class II aldolase/adducin family protein [Kocuria coralli]KAA9393052.1 aldolase [Kocuria coralli]
MSTIPEATVDAARVGRRVVELGLSPGASGNLSVRAEGVTYMSPTGVSLSALDPEQLAVMSAEGVQLSGPRASKEYPLHEAMYAKDPEARAVIHLHSAQAMAASCLRPASERSALPPVTPYLVMRVGRVPSVAYAPPGSKELGEELASVEGLFHGALLANHGLIVSGRDLAQALDRAVEVEEACRLYVQLFDAPARWLTEDDVAVLTQRYGTPW